MSVAHTTANIQNSVPRPVLLLSHSRIMQGSATHRLPAASHSGAAARSCNATRHTTTAPPSASAAPAARPNSPAAMTATAMTPISTGASFDPPPHRWPHSQAMTAAAPTVRTISKGPPNQMPTIGSGARTSADRTRRRSDPPLTGANRRPIAPLAPTIIGDCLLQIVTAEIGPQRLGEDELGIGALPQQEVADALLAAGADQQIGIGDVGGEEMPRDHVLIDRVRRQLTRHGLRREHAHRRDD